MDYYEQRQRERQEDQFFEPPYCDECGGEHETRNCPEEEEDDDYDNSRDEVGEQIDADDEYLNRQTD